jgi:hypothetical protein
MHEQFFGNNLGYIISGLITIVLFAQTYVMLRIRNILQAITMNQDSLLYYMRKLTNFDKRKKTSATTFNTCQFCKHRMAYINSGDSKNVEEDFYHRCGLRNIQVRLEDSCRQFEAEKSSESE